MPDRSWLFSWQHQAVTAEVGEMPLDLGVGDLGERGGVPARRVVLVDDHSAHALVEIMASNDARHYAEFRLHARCEVQGFAAAYLRQREFKAERRFGPDVGGGA